MRDNGPITQNEVLVPDDEVIVSQTDVKGRITFCNETFVRISGYSEQELIGAPHNILRHPHVPAAAFADLWATIKRGKTWEGLVKNRTKSGDFYWVRANVTPVMEGGRITGYISIRTKPRRAQVAAAERLYAGLRNGEIRNVRIHEGAVLRIGPVGWLGRFGASIAGRIALACATLPLVAAAAGWAGQSQAGLAAVGLVVGVAAALGGALACGLIRRFRRALGDIESHYTRLAAGDLRQEIETSPVQEFRRFSMLLRSRQAQLVYDIEAKRKAEQTAREQRVAALRQMADTVEAEAHETTKHVSAMADAVTERAEELVGSSVSVTEHAEGVTAAANRALGSAEAVAAAAEELSASIGEINRRVESASSLTRSAVTEGEQTREAMTRLHQEVDRIGQVASLIAEIAGQTNLLALNATIEAARAGEAGKGFAVVASEVKSLAQQTSRSTAEIARQIADIQKAMADTAEAVSGIGGRVQEIDTVSAAIAAAVSQQSGATAEISRAVNETALAAREVTRLIESVSRLAGEAGGHAGGVRDDIVAVSRSTTERQRHLVEAVRTATREADRRMEQRHTTDLACELLLDGVAHAGRLRNVSPGGTQWDGEVVARVGARGKLRLRDLPEPLVVVVRGAQKDFVNLAFIPGQPAVRLLLAQLVGAEPVAA